MKKLFYHLKKKFEAHFSSDDIDLIKTDYDQHQVLFFQFYRESIITLVNHYQDYKSLTADFQQKFAIVNDVGEPTNDWLERYQQSNSARFFAEVTPQRLKLICDGLSTFKEQIQLENPKEFLQQIKNKIHRFLDNQIQQLGQEFQKYRIELIRLASSFKLSPHEIDKLLEAKQSQCLTIQQEWITRKKRLERINHLEDLKNFKQHFPNEKLFLHSLDLEKTAFQSAFTLLDPSTSLNEKNHLLLAVSNLSQSDLAERMMLILEIIDTQQLPNRLTALLQLIHSESTDPIIKETKQYFAHSLEAFFTVKSEKTAFCLAKTINHAPFILDVETHGNLLNYLRLINFTELKKFKEKINTAFNNELTEDEVKEAIQQLIVTKETLSLFEDNPVPKTVWDACLLFKKFYNASSRFQPTTYPFLNTTNHLAFIQAVESLNALLRKLEGAAVSRYSSNLFLKPNKQKQKRIENLIKDLKNTPISQADKNYINDFFEKWRNENDPSLKEPRYRLFIGVFMLIYRHIKKLFSHSEFETHSCQTVKELQEFFTSACEDLEQIKVAFDPFPSKLHQNIASESEKSFTRSL